MRMESDTVGAGLPDRLRASGQQIRRWWRRQARPTRAALVLLGLGLIGGAGYLAAGEHSTGTGAVTLYDGQRLSSDDLAAITAALNAEGIPFKALDFPTGQVFVRVDRRPAAFKAIAQHKAAPITLDQLNRPDEPESPWGLTSAERESRERIKLEQNLKRQIEGLGMPITYALVTVKRERAYGNNLAERWKVFANVYLRIEGGRRLGSTVVDGIGNFLVGAVPDLKPDAITVTDQTGHRYMAAGNPEVNADVRKHVREEEWQERIAEGLQHIPGVRVAVTLETLSIPPPTVEIPPPPTTAGEVAAPNRPLRIVPPPRAQVVATGPAETRERANVWVRVPRSFYLRAAEEQSGGRHPSGEMLKAMEETTRGIAIQAVNVTIPHDLKGGVQVDTVQDDLAASRTVLVPPDPTEPTPLRWVVGGVAGSALGVVVLGATALRLATRRPGPRPHPAWRPGFLADEAGPGASERVRELIRLDPQAAAGVLQRWVGQKGALG